MIEYDLHNYQKVKAIDYPEKEFNFAQKSYRLKRFGKYREGFYYFDYKEIKKQDKQNESEICFHVMKNKEEIPIDIPNFSSKKEFKEFSNRYALNEKGDKMIAIYWDKNQVKANRFVYTQKGGQKGAAGRLFKLDPTLDLRPIA